MLKMKYLKSLLASIAVFTLCACVAKSSSKPVTESMQNQVADSVDAGVAQEIADVIKTVYEKYVFAIDEDSDSEVNMHPEKYFTANALRKLKNSYVYDSERDDCYAYYELRTAQQDTRPGTDGESYVISIESIGNHWYVVKYSDMGWLGYTRIKIADGKVDDYLRCYED